MARKKRSTALKKKSGALKKKSTARKKSATGTVSQRSNHPAKTSAKIARHTPPRKKQLKYDMEIETRVDREIAAFLEEEYAAKGEKLYQWYQYRFLAAKNQYLTSSIGLAHYDKAIAHFVIERCSFADSFVEIGAAAGQESILLAMMGMSTCAVGWNADNFDMMKRLVARIAERLDPDLPKRMTTRDDYYPDRAVEYVDAKTIVAFPTLSGALDAVRERAILDSLRSAGGVILSLYDFYRHRAQPAEQAELIAQIRELGFGAPVDVRAWDKWDMGFRPDRIVFLRNLAAR